ncbi:hypothetical protein [Arcicella rosea]|uniref:Uncharacterized protein n=1 Tax=Arcicella rosea TaxID=502909 RepID=A0A841EPR8_9BACT|nr:hypothetical protein [Arcicella rosea]MBB6002718.1 hypothetical protein [Arcicella rosea]
MKKALLFIIFNLFAYPSLLACPVCESRQPKFLRGITHGAGPESNWDWIIVSSIALITLFTLIYSVKYLLKPESVESMPIKNLFLE